MGNENKSFSYTYSGATNDELEQIKIKYTKKEVNEKMKKIRALDKRVDFISTMLSISLGIFGTSFIIQSTIWIIKGITDLTVSIPMCILGILLASTVPFLHAKIYSIVKAHYAPKILALIKEVEQNQL